MSENPSVVVRVAVAITEEGVWQAYGEGEPGLSPETRRSLDFGDMTYVLEKIGPVPTQRFYVEFTVPTDATCVRAVSAATIIPAV